MGPAKTLMQTVMHLQRIGDLAWTQATPEPSACPGEQQQDNTHHGGNKRCGALVPA